VNGDKHVSYNNNGISKLFDQKTKENTIVTYFGSIEYKSLNLKNKTIHKHSQGTLGYTTAYPEHLYK
jgi:hypothetical protein